MASSSPTVLATGHCFIRRLRNDLSSRFHSRVDEKSRTPLLILRCWWSYYSSGHVSGFLFPLFFRCLQEDHDPKNVLPIRASRALVALNIHPSQVRVMRFQGGSNLWMCSLLLLPLSRYSCSSQAKTKTMAGRICQFCLLLGQSFF